MEEPGEHTVEWGKWIGEGFQMFIDDWAGWLIRMLVLLLIIAIPAIPIYGIFIAGQFIAATGEEPNLPPFVWILTPFLVLLIMLATALAYAGAYRAAFRQLKGENTSIGQMFSSGNTVLRVIGTVLLISIVVMVGLVFCIVPGYIALGRLHYAVPLVVERDLGIMDALRTSWAATRRHWVQFTLFSIVVQLIGQLGSALCGVGLLFTFPLFFTITVISYRDIFGVGGARSFVSRTPQASYASAASAEPPRPGEWRPTCPHCGATVISSTAKFCNVCGGQLIP